MSVRLSNNRIGHPQPAPGADWRARLAAGCALAAQAVLIAMVTVAPWLFGGVQLRDQQWLFAAASAAVLLVAVKMMLAPSGAIPLAAAPLVAGVLLGALQLVPLERSTLSVLSPAAARLRAELTPAHGSESPGTPPLDGADSKTPLSLYPASTRHDLAMLILALAVFTCGALVFASPRAGLALAIAVAVGGALLAFFEIAQQLTWSLAWRNAWSDASRTFGPFINRNNAAGYLNLCLAGALAVLIWAGARAGLSGPTAPMPRALGWRAFLRPLARLNATTLGSLALAACIVAGVLCSMSRGGALAMLGAAAVTGLAVLAARRSGLRLWWLGAVAIAGLSLVAWIGKTGNVQARLATLLDRSQLATGRIPHWRDGLKAAADFWPLGSGLGTYRFVYPLYQQRSDIAWYVHAENDPLEALVETGTIGLALLLAMVVAVAAAAWRLLVWSGTPQGVALAVAGLFALSTQALHGLADFGLYIPANMLLFALLCGAVIGASQLSYRRLALVPARPQRFPRGSWLFFPILLGPLVWGGMEVRAGAEVEKEALAAQPLVADGTAEPEPLRAAIQRVAAALAGRPDDAEGQQYLASLWIARYRAEAAEQLRKELGPKATPARLAELTSLFALHQRAHEFCRNHWRDKLDVLAGQRVVSDSLPRAVACALAAVRACPLLAEAHFVLAQLAVLGGDPAADQVHLARTRRLCPGNPETLFRCGLLEFQAGRSEQAAWDWRRSLTLSTRRTAEILRLAEEQMSLPYLVEKVLPDSPELLVYLARTRYAGSYHDYARRLLAQRSEKLLDRSRLEADQRHYLRGATLLLEGRRPEAIREYQQAVDLRPRDPEWRYELAVLLKEEGNLAEAHQHACLCAALAPHNGDYRNLLKQINHTRLTGTSLK